MGNKNKKAKKEQRKLLDANSVAVEAEVKVAANDASLEQRFVDAVRDCYDQIDNALHNNEINDIEGATAFMCQTAKARHWLRELSDARRQMEGILKDFNDYAREADAE